MQPFDTHPDQPLRKARAGVTGIVVPWMLFLILVGAGVAAYKLRHQPLERAHAALMTHFNEQSAARQRAEDEISSLRPRHAALVEERAALVAKLEQTNAERDAAIAELQKMKAELSDKLEAEIAAGEVMIQQRGDELVLNVADKILFRKGEAEVSERGQQILKDVAATLLRLDSHVVQVGGHTDNAPITSPTVRERYPTNWELSAVRATNVVKLLQSEGKIPGDRLMAVGFAEFRPTASNQSKAGQQRNRRIEVVLLRKRH